jgi:hypothetical protein
MRSLSAPARQAAFAQETGEAFVALLIIDHPTLDAPLRFVNNMEDVYSTVGGVAEPQQYFGCPFTVNLPEERDDQLPTVTLSIDNVDQAIVAAIRGLTGAPTLTLYIVLASSPNVIEAGPFVFQLTRAQYTAETVSGQLSFPDVLNEPFPWRAFTPNDWPGVFA